MREEMTGRTARCMYCRRQEGRNELARILEENPHLQGRPGSHVLRDQQDGYSVTGLAAGELAGVIWVQHGGRWQCFHPETFQDQSIVKEAGKNRYQQNWTVDDDTMELLIEAAGTPDHDTCPEEVFALLGINTDTWPDPGQVELNRAALAGEHARLAGEARALDELDFRTAARLLREVPGLLEECGCQSEEEWLLSQDLLPHQIILPTGEPGAQLDRDDLIIAGMLSEAGTAGDGDERQLERGWRVLRDSTWLWQAKLRSLEDNRMPVRGARLSDVALELREPVMERREAHRRFMDSGNQQNSREIRRLQEQSDRYDRTRLQVMWKHGLAPPGAERVLEELEGEGARN